MNGCTHDCQSCGGCPGCGGCLTAREVVLTREEAALLSRFAAVPYLPVCREGGELLFPAGEDLQRGGRIAQALAGRGLLSLDEDLPLTGCDYSEFPPSSGRGSAALTPLGQAVLEELPDLL